MDPLAIEMALVALGSYLLGSIPFGYLLVKLFLKEDIRRTGSGNIGATNVARSGKKGLAVATLLLDLGKGAAAALAALVLTPNDFPSSVFVSIAAFFAIVGHCFPIWLRFKGGKGVATAVGALAVLSPKAVLVAVVCFAVLFALTRYVSLGSIFSAIIFPIAFYFLEPQMRYGRIILVAPFLIAISVLIIAKHHGNIRRLFAGTEPKFGKQAIGTNDPCETEKNI